MKKIVYIVFSLLVLGSASFAQDKATKAPAKKEAAPAKDAKAAKTKKDGTPDMRFKQNKAAAKPAGPTKKDGTPDKRFKANKTEAAKAK